MKTKSKTSAYIIRGVAAAMLLTSGVLAVGLSLRPSNTITVTNTNDSGVGSLRQALTDANNGDTIEFDAALNGQTITLTSGQLAVNKSVTISGPGVDQLAVSGNNASRVFNIASGTTVTISGLTIANGHGIGSDWFGGGIYNDGALTVTKAVISGNSADGFGGGVFNSARGSLTVVNSTISGNSAPLGAGGLYNGNRITVTGSTIAGNFGGNAGGAIENDVRAILAVVNSTLSGNSTNNGGGGIFNNGNATLTATNVTVTGNSAGYAGGVFSNSGAIETLNNTIVAGNFGAGGTNDDIGGTIDTANNNLIGDAATSGGITNGTNGNIVGNHGIGTININTVLDTALADNGGPTNTHKLVANSAAINAGNNALAVDADNNPLTTDQRGTGFPREFDGTVDIGAYEVQTAAPPTLGNYADTSTALSTDTTVTPDAAPTNTTSINVSTSTDFKGTLEGDPATGVVRVTDAHPAGAYTVTVRAFSADGASTTKTFTLTVTTPVTCTPVSFAVAANFGTGAYPYSAAVGDFNGDGKQDLAVANQSSNNVSILLGDGAGNFSAATNFGAGGNPSSVAVGDFNGDGNQDLAVANIGSNNVSILLGDGAGNFSAPTNFGAGYGLYSVAVGDFNADGKQDLAIGNAFLDTVSILLGDGAGSFSAATNFSAGSGPYSVAVGDFNGDGKQDLTLVNFYSNKVSILLGDGAGNFSAPTSFDTGTAPYSVAVGDFNGDGNQDLAVANESYTVSILLGDGGGSFSAATNFAAGSLPYSIAVGDFNGDGKQDLTAANFSSNNVSILLGDGAGSFSAATNFDAGTNPTSVAVGDFNGDGKQDLAVANRNSNNVSILLRNCDQPPIADAGGPYAGTAGQAIQFDGSGSYDPDGSIVDYAWTFGDGGTASGVNPTHTYESPGTYVASLTVTDELGATGMDTAIVTVTEPPPIQVRVQTNPAGRSFTVDGTTYTAAHRFSWVPGSSHTIATTSPQSGGTGVQYVWTKWSDHGAISHTVVPTTNAIYTAAFKTQYFLTMTHGTGGRVNPSSGWKNSGATVSINATPNSAYSFTNWTGTGTGSYSGPNNPASITMSGPITENAAFIHN